MTPKEKAKELIEKMNVIHYQKIGRLKPGSKGLPISMYNSQRKQCAIICINETLKSLEQFTNLYLAEKEREYLQRVKREISKL